MTILILTQEMDAARHELLKITSFVLEALKLIPIHVLDVLVILNPIVIRPNE